MIGEGFKPLLSVVMPCYNEEKNIRKSIDSVLRQSFIDFEFIIVDDCSSDNTLEIVKSYDDKRIIVLHNEKNSGVARSLNKGLEIANGKYIARMDADDICENNRFEKQIAYLEEHPNCIVCGSLSDVSNGERIRIQGKKAYHMGPKKYLTINNPFIHSSVLFRRIIHGEKTVYPIDKGFEDYALWIELCDKGDFIIIPDILVHRFDDNNLSTKKTWEGFNKKSIYKKLAFYQKKAIIKTKRVFPGIWYLIATRIKAFVAS